MTGDGSKSRILLLGDDYNILDRLNISLSERGYLVSNISGDYEELESMLESFEPALVIIDTKSGLNHGIKLSMRTRLCSQAPTLLINSLEAEMENLGEPAFGYSERLNSTISVNKMVDWVDNIVDRTNRKMSQAVSMGGNVLVPVVPGEYHSCLN